MFTLRRFTGNGVQMNQAVGNEYTFIHRERNPEDFKLSFEIYFEKAHVADLDPTADNDTKDCYAFVVNGSFVQPLYKQQESFIMTAGGKTFDNVSFR